jgi:inorganic pyrophosphatase
MTTNGAAVKTPSKQPTFQSTPLNQRILSTMERRTVAAHPWHDLEIGQFQNYSLYSVPLQKRSV